MKSNLKNKNKNGIMTPKYEELRYQHVVVGLCTRRVVMHGHAEVGARGAKWLLGDRVGCDRLGRLLSNCVGYDRLGRLLGGCVGCVRLERTISDG